jgi:hypothetical protein
MRFFVQSLDGDARNWFKEFPPRSVDGIATLDDSFLRHWGNKKDLLYYVTEFGALVITLNCTTHAYLASGQLRSLPCQSHAE